MMTTMTNMFEEGELLLTAPMMATWFYVGKVEEEAAFSMSLALMYYMRKYTESIFLSITMIYHTK